LDKVTHCTDWVRTIQFLLIFVVVYNNVSLNHEGRICIAPPSSYRYFVWPCSLKVIIIIMRLLNNKTDRTLLCKQKWEEWK